MGAAAIKARAEVPFCSDEEKKGDEIIAKAGQKWSAGDGVVIKFTNSDLKRIESELGANWFQQMCQSAEAVPTVTFLEALVKNGAKKDGKPFEVTEAVLDDIPVIDLGLKLLDAACVAMKGKTAKEYFEEVFAALAEATAKGEPDPNLSSPDGTL